MPLFQSNIIIGWREKDILNNRSKQQQPISTSTSISAFHFSLYCINMPLWFHQWLYAEEPLLSLYGMLATPLEYF